MRARHHPSQAKRTAQVQLPPALAGQAKERQRALRVPILIQVDRRKTRQADCGAQLRIRHIAKLLLDSTDELRFSDSVGIKLRW